MMRKTTGTAVPTSYSDMARATRRDYRHIPLLIICVKDMLLTSRYCHFPFRSTRLSSVSSFSNFFDFQYAFVSNIYATLCPLCLNISAGVLFSFA